MEELPNILWGFRTTPHRAIGETPFNIVYGSEAILPLEIGMETARIFIYDPKDNVPAQVEELDLVEKRQMRAFYLIEGYQSQVQ